jgi:hypothetical protein
MKLFAVIIFLFSTTLYSFGQIKTLHIPQDIAGESYEKFYLWENQITKEFDLLKLSEDTTANQIFYRISNQRQIIEVYKINENYFGKITSYIRSTVDYDKRNKRKKSKLFSVETEISSDTAKIIYERLVELDSLPDMSEIVNWRYGCDGTTYVFESSTPEHYSIRKYWTPHVYSETIPTAYKINEFITFLFEEMGMYKIYDEFTSKLSPGNYSDGFLGISISKRRMFWRKN